MIGSNDRMPSRVDLRKLSDHCLEARWMGVSPIGANSFPHSLAAKLETAATSPLEGISGDLLPLFMADRVHQCLPTN